MSLRAQFPVFDRVAYLNAGTTGPVPAAARTAWEQVYDLGEGDGRRLPYFERTMGLQAQQRAAYAAVLGAEPDDVALTSSTSEGIVRVVAGLELREGDEILTSDAEHPGLLGPLVAARSRFGVTIRAVPLAEIANAVGERTRLVACSHVGWLRGDVAPPLREVADAGIPVLLDGAQGLGAIPVDVRQLGVSFYAGSGQKWLCGPVGTGALYVDPSWSERLHPIGPTYMAFAAPYGPVDDWQLHEGARRHDPPALAPELSAAAVAALDLLQSHGLHDLQSRARVLAGRFVERLTEAGRRVAPRGDTTLVAFEDPTPKETVARLAAAGVAVRDLPGTPYIRCSVGAWNDESDLERLLEAL